MCLAVGLVLFACGPNQLDSSTFEDLAVCGNGELEAGEACDDGNDAPLDACTVGCQIAVCGDGIARQDLSPDEEGYESCDDGNDLDGDACLSICRLATCGDGYLRQVQVQGQVGFEDCDDGTDLMKTIAPMNAGGLVAATEFCDRISKRTKRGLRPVTTATKRTQTIVCRIVDCPTAVTELLDPMRCVTMAISIPAMAVPNVVYPRVAMVSYSRAKPVMMAMTTMGTSVQRVTLCSLW